MKNIKSVISLILVVLLTVTTMSVAFGASGEGEYVYSVLDDGTVSIDGVTGEAVALEIPSTINGKAVTKIGDRAFEYNTTLTSVSLPDTVTVIGEKAFNDCVNLMSISFGSGLSEIGKDAFFSCTRLNNVTLPNTLKTLGDGAFYDCKSLESITVPSSVESFGEYVFGYNDSLKSVTVEEGITKIPALTFYADASLMSVSLPTTLTVIGRKAFCRCSALESITIPTSVNELEEKAFYACRALTALSFNGEIIGDEALAECNALNELSFTGSLKTIGADVLNANGFVTSIELPNTVEYIAPTAFVNTQIESLTIDEGCENYVAEDNVIYSSDMTKLISYIGVNYGFTVPDSVTEIGDYAFFGAQIDNIGLPEGLKTIGDYAFKDSHIMNALIPNGVESIGEGAFSDCTSLFFASLPSSLKEISDKAFYMDSSLVTVYINDGVEAIGDDAFTQCSSLENFTVPQSVKELSANSFTASSIIDALDLSNNDSFVVEDGVLYNSDKTTLIMYVNSDYNYQEYTIPDSVTAIGDAAFCTRNYITTVYVPSSVSELGEYSLGYSRYNEKSDNSKVQMQMIGEAGSTAQDYANANDIAFFTEAPTLNAETVTLSGGETFTLVLNGAETSDVVFNTSDESVATVDDNGTITAVGKGSTAVIASLSNVYFVCRVTVTSDGNANTSTLLDSYAAVTRETSESWISDYYNANSNVQFSKMDYPAIYCYTTEQYVPIVATQKGGHYLDETLETYGEDYRQYYTMSDNLSNELQRFKLHTGTILYSGTGNVSAATGTDSTLKEMRAAIGKRYTDPAVISTSIAYDVASIFSTGSNYGTVLEIYAPKGFSKGAYIQSISNVESEYELLLDKGIEFEVLDAGYKEVTYKSFPISSIGDGSERTTTEIKRFLKLLIIDTGSEDETTAPTEATVATTAPTSATTVATEAPTARTVTVSSATTASGTTTTSTTTDSGTVKTGDSRLAIALLILLLSALAFFIIQNRRKIKKSNK